MTFITQPTEEGETKECPSCGMYLISRLKEYQDFPNKIQWQDKDQTKAHYDKNGNCKESSKDDEAQEAPPSPKPTLDIPEMDIITSSHIDKELILISQIEKKVISHLGDTTNPAKIGLYVKLIYDGIVRQ